LRLGVVNLPSKSRQDPTVNESGNEVLVELLLGKRELFLYSHYFSISKPSLISLSSSTKICDK
jgi:competence protein ComGC